MFPFLSRVKASVDDRSPWGDFWFQPVSVHTASGMRVSADSALAISAVYAAVRLLSNQFAILPFVLYKRKANGGKQRITNHWLYTLFSKAPNAFQNAFEWRRMMCAHLELRGNAYNRIIDDGRGGVAQLMPIHPDRCAPDVQDNGGYRYKITEPDGSTTYLPRGQVFHLRNLSLDGILGLSTVACARESIGLAQAAQNYGSRFFANDARPGGWIEFPGKFSDEMARKTFRDAWQAAQTGLHRGKTAVLEGGMKYNQLDISNEDAQFLETRKFQISEIARWFGVPPHKIGDLDKATFSNIEQQAMEFIQDSLMPRAEMWEAAIRYELLLEDDGLDIEFDFAKLLRGDSGARTAYYSSGIQWGWFTRNEARMRENLDPIDGLDEPMRPLNMVEESEAEEQEDASADPDNDQDADTDPAVAPESDTARRLRSMVESGAQRLARRFARDGKADAQLVADALAIPLEKAAAWCAGLDDATLKDETTLTGMLTRLGGLE